MKDQYFGDVNDFRKYGLLRALVQPLRLRLGVCWMLTEPDHGADGNFLSYLSQPKKYRHRDPELFDWLNQVTIFEQDRRTVRIEQSALLGTASFHSRFLTDNPSERNDYFTEHAELLGGCDLVFFDPDNGLENKSTLRGRKNSRKYLYWHEVSDAFTTGSSVLIYQHFIRESRDTFITGLIARLRSQTGANTIFTFRTPHVLFLLASQGHHAAGFREQLATIGSVWAGQIQAVEHPVGNSSESQC